MKFSFVVFICFFIHTTSFSQDISLKEAKDLYELGKKSFDQQDYANAFKYLLNAANGKYTEAYYSLGLLYENGLGTEKNPEQAFHWYMALANTGSGLGQYVIAKCYYNGYGVEKNDATSWTWICKAADNGEPLAEFYMAQAYYQGVNVTKDDTQMLKWLRKAADHKHAEAEYNLGIIYQEGIYVTKDVNQSIEWFKKSAEQNYTDAQYALAIIYSDGVYVDKDLDQAFHWFEKAANNGHIDSQYKVGLMYMMGYSVKPNTEEAIKWFKKASDQGNEKAKELLTSLEKERVTKLDTASFKGLKKPIDKKELQTIKNWSREMFVISPSLSINISFEDLIPLKSRVPEQASSNKKVSELKKAVDKNPGDYKLYFSLGNALLKMNKRADGFKAFDQCESILKAQILKSETDSLHYWLAFAYYKRELYNDALTQFDAWLTKHPDDESVQFAKITAYMNLGDAQKVAEIGALIRQKDPKSANGYIIGGIMILLNITNGSYTTEDFKTRPVDQLLDQSELLAAIEKYPDEIDLKIVYNGLKQMVMLYKFGAQGLGDTTFTIKNPDDMAEVNKLEKFYFEALENKNLPSKFTIYKFLSSLYLFKADYKKTIENAYKALEIKKTEPITNYSSPDEIYDLLEATYFLEKDTLQAQKIVNEKITNETDEFKNAANYVSLARYQLHYNDIKGAEKSLKKAVEINPDEKTAWIGNAVLAVMAGNAAKTDEAIKKAPSPNDNEDYRKTLEALSAIFKSDYKNAYKLLNNALILDSECDIAQKYLNAYFK